MRLIIWILLILISLGLALIIANKNSYSLSGFILGGVILSLIFFGTISSIIVGCMKLNDKRYLGGTIFLLVFLVGIIIITLILYISFNKSTSCLTMVTPSHFRTNILTERCNFGGGSPCVSNDPWYFKPDCNSEEDKLNAVKGIYYYGQRKDECTKLCKNKFNEGDKYNSLKYCADDLYNIRCDNFISCPNINC